MIKFIVRTDFTSNKFEKAALRNALHKIPNVILSGSLRLQKDLLPIYDLKGALHFYMSIWL